MKYRTVIKKDLPYLPLFKSDWLSSKKVRRCSAATRGIYADLMCVLHDEERHGCYSLHMQEEKWRKSRSKTNLALAKPDGYQRLPFFADFLVSRIGSPKKVILKALKELYERKIIVVEGDSLIQPRMYTDSEYKLLPETEVWLAQSDDHEIVMEPVVDDAEDEGSGTGKKDTKKTIKKTTKKSSEKSRARADAYATRAESESENKNNSIGSSKGGVGETAGSAATSRSVKTETSDSEKSDKTAHKAPARRPVGDNPPSLDDIQAYCDERREQQKPFLYITAEEFLDICTVSNWTRGKKNEPIYDWKAYLRQCDLYRQRHGDVQVGQSPRQQDKSSRIGQDAAVPASTTHEGKYKKRM